MLLMALTIPLPLLGRDMLSFDPLGITYYFSHEGNPAYVWASYDQFSDVLCPALAELKDSCGDGYSLKVGGLIFLGLSALVFLVQLIDLLQTLLIRGKLFSATTKVDIYGLSPVIYALGIIIYGFIMQLYQGNYMICWGLILAFFCEFVLIVFALVAMVLERAENPSGAQEPLLPLHQAEVEA